MKYTLYCQQSLNGRFLNIETIEAVNAEVALELYLGKSPIDKRDDSLWIVQNNDDNGYLDMFKLKQVKPAWDIIPVEFRELLD